MAAMTTAPPPPEHDRRPLWAQHAAPQPGPPPAPQPADGGPPPAGQAPTAADLTAATWTGAPHPQPTPSHTGPPPTPPEAPPPVDQTPPPAHPPTPTPSTIEAPPGPTPTPPPLVPTLGRWIAPRHVAALEVWQTGNAYAVHALTDLTTESGAPIRLQLTATRPTVEQAQDDLDHTAARLSGTIEPGTAHDRPPTNTPLAP